MYQKHPKRVVPPNTHFYITSWDTISVLGQGQGSFARSNPKTLGIFPSIKRTNCPFFQSKKAKRYKKETMSRFFQANTGIPVIELACQKVHQMSFLVEQRQFFIGTTTFFFIRTQLIKKMMTIDKPLD
jgi:hypothetical protein